MRTPCGLLLSLALATACSTSGPDTPGPGEPAPGSFFIDQVGLAPVDKVDLVFMVDNSSSMADKQKVLARTVPDLLTRLVDPDCVELDADGKVIEATRQRANGGACSAGLRREFRPLRDVHV
ncbi:MAG: hypothetical protein EOO75_03500, partial [Myxococcales bacterium]